MQVQLQRERAPARAPLPLLVLSPVLLLLNEHYCWSGRAPLNSAGAPQAERSERAALTPPPLCCPAWTHFGGGFPTDKADLKPSCGFLHQGEFFSCAEELFNSPPLVPNDSPGELLSVRPSVFFFPTPHSVTLSRDNRSSSTNPCPLPCLRAFPCGPRCLAFLPRRTGHYLGSGSAGRTRSEGRTEPGDTQRGVSPLPPAEMRGNRISSYLCRLCLMCRIRGFHPLHPPLQVCCLLQSV